MRIQVAHVRPPGRSKRRLLPSAVVDRTYINIVGFNDVDDNVGQPRNHEFPCSGECAAPPRLRKHLQSRDCLTDAPNHRPGSLGVGSGYVLVSIKQVGESRAPVADFHTPIL